MKYHSAALLALTTATLLGQVPGNLTFERWTGVPGGPGISLLKEIGISQRPADISQLVAGAATPQDQGNYYGARLRGTFTAPVTGNYTFFLSSDDTGELWLSGSASGMDKRPIAFNTKFTGYNDWEKYETQRSRMFVLQAGRQYYIEALMKENTLGDHLSIGWSYESTVALQQMDIGTPVTAGWTEINGSHTASVTSGDIWENSDRFSTSLRPWSGDGEFITRISGMNHPHKFAKAGIMVRGDTGAGAQNAMVALTGSNGMTFQYRASTSSTSSAATYGGEMEWVKLVRKGDILSGYVSADGNTWRLVSSATLTDLPTDIHIGLAASNHGKKSPVTATFSHFSASPLSASEVIPASQLTSFAADPLDADGDNLPDAWQSQFPITGTAFEKSEFGDPDGDLLTNLEESQLGTDPNTPGSKPAHWLRERWYGTTGYDVADLVMQDAFYQTPDFTGLTTGSVAQQEAYSGTRMRAVLTAPESGDYIFWVSGRGATELWLSTDGDKYSKKRIAVMGADSGTGHGVPSSSAAMWDTYASQMSAPVRLVAGEQYFVEVLAQNGHVADDISLAWARPGGERERLDTSHIVSYAKDLVDSDDDYLPDGWETQHGLNPLDNGFADRKKQGERGDFDSDGLTNREEYLLGTNPSNADTDGDGIGDYTEVRVSGTDALVSNAPNSAVVSTVDVLAHQGSNLTWTFTGTGIVADQFRGWIEWDFSVPLDGVWLLDLETALRGSPRMGDTIGFDIVIDGIDVGRRSLIYGSSSKNTLRLVTPYLTQGTHKLRVNIDNMIARRTVEITALNVLEASGLDIDGNGIVDWVETILLESDHVSSHALASNTSPFCLEGHALVVSAVRVNGNAVTLGIDDNHWFRNIHLDPSIPSPYVATFASGFSQARTIIWETTDILTSPAITIRVGDTLKLGANFTHGSGDTTITTAGQSYTVAGSQAALHTFATKGQFTVNASRSGAAPVNLGVNVIGASFSGLPTLVENTVTSWTLEKSMVDPSLVMQSGKGLRLGDYSNVDSTRFSHMLFPSTGGRLAVAARIGEEGPIVDIAEFVSVGFSDALQNDLTDTYDLPEFPGYYVVGTPVVVTNLPPGATIKITIFRSGVMFRDGSTVGTFTADDLVNGILNLEFLFPKGASGGYCHYVKIYDAAGNLIANR